MSIQLVQQTPGQYSRNVTLLNDNKLRLHGEPLEGNQPGRLPWMCFELVQNYPYIRVNFNNGKQKEEGSMSLALDQVAFNAILSALEDATRAKEPTMITIAVKRQGFDRQTNKPTEPYIYATVTVGKDADGCEFIGIQRAKPGSNKYISLKFGFTAPEFHPILDTATGQPTSRQRVSNLIARGFVRLLNQYMTILNAFTWKYENTGEGKYALKRAEQQGNGGNNQGGYQGGSFSNRANGNNGGYNNSGNRAGNVNGASNTSSQSGDQQPSKPQEDAGYDENLPW